MAAARRALAEGDVRIVLPYVQTRFERDVRGAFEETLPALACDPPVRALAERWFFETVVRLHRTGEGAPFTGLKPAGLGFGPVVPVAEAAIASRDPHALMSLLAQRVREQAERRFERVMTLQQHADEDVEHARTYVEAMLGLEVWAHGLYEAAGREAHAGRAEGAGEVHESTTNTHELAHAH